MKEKQEPRKNRVIPEEINPEKKEEKRKEEGIEKNSSSSIGTTHFSKDHGRSHPPLGEGHEPGTIPGSGV